MSIFSVTGNASEEQGMDDLPIDESRMEKAMHMLAAEAGNINEDDPRQAANLTVINGNLSLSNVPAGRRF